MDTPQGLVSSQLRIFERESNHAKISKPSLCLNFRLVGVVSGFLLIGIIQIFGLDDLGLLGGGWMKANSPSLHLAGTFYSLSEPPKLSHSDKESSF